MYSDDGQSAHVLHLKGDGGEADAEDGLKRQAMIPLLFVPEDGTRNKSQDHRTAISLHIQRIRRLQRSAYTGRSYASLAEQQPQYTGMKHISFITHTDSGGRHQNEEGSLDSPTESQASVSDFADVYPVALAASTNFVPSPRNVHHYAVNAGASVGNRQECLPESRENLELSGKHQRLHSSVSSAARPPGTLRAQSRSFLACRKGKPSASTGTSTEGVPPQPGASLLPTLPVHEGTDLITKHEVWQILGRCSAKESPDQQALSQLFPGEGGKLSPATTSWMHAITTSPAAFASRVFTQNVRDAVVNGSQARQAHQIGTMYYSKALALIHKDMASMDTACTDGSMLAMLALATHRPLMAPFTAQSIALPKPNQGPLDFLGLLRVYGGPIHDVEVHWEALSRVVAFNGGLEALTLPGLAAIMSYMDLIRACRACESPKLEYIPKFPTSLDAALMKARQSNHPLRKMSRGFDIFPRIVSSPRSSEQTWDVWLALEGLALYTLHVDDYISRRQTCESLSVIGELRNNVQHRLMALLPRVCDESTPPDLVSLALLAGIVYSFTCTFPIASAPFAKLSTWIRRIYEATNEGVEGNKDEESMYTLASHQNKRAAYKPSLYSTKTPASPIPKESQPLTVWILTMGAIAAVSSSLGQRSWYSGVLARCLSQQNIESWPELKALLLDFLWLPLTNDVDGMGVFDDSTGVLVAY